MQQGYWADVRTLASDSGKKWVVLGELYVFCKFSDVVSGREKTSSRSRMRQVPRFS
jgi:hypothetical protein